MSKIANKAGNADNDASKNANNDVSINKIMMGQRARAARRPEVRTTMHPRFASLYTNAQSLVNKMSEMRAIAVINNPDILIITETWTNEAISDEYLNIRGYDVV